MNTALDLLIFVALVAIPICFIGFVLAIFRKKPYIKWQKRTRYSLISFFVFVVTELIFHGPILNTFMYGIRIFCIVLFVEALMDLLVSIVANKPKLKWVLILCSSIAFIMISSAGINAMNNVPRKSQDAASSETDYTDDDADTNDDDDDDTTADSTSSDDSSSDSSSVAASSKAAASKSEQASSKAASKSMSLDSYKKSLQALVLNDSVHLSSYQLSNNDTITYTAKDETAAMDQEELQAYADNLFDKTRQTAAMCDMSTPAYIVLQAPNGNWLARTKLDGSAKVYPQ